MSRVLVLGICSLLFFSSDGEEEGWIWSLHGISNEDDGSGDKVNNFFGMGVWRMN